MSAPALILGSRRLTVKLSAPGPQGPPGSSGVGSVDWSTVANKPSTFPPATHSHTIPDVSGLQSALDVKAALATTLAGYGITDAAPLSHVGAGGTAHANAIASGAAGFLSGADKAKLDGVAAGATANATDAQLRDRSTHTGTQAAGTISGLAAVATSGAYSSLSGVPTLGTAAPLNVPASGNAAAGEVVKGSDTRLTDSRTPTAHTHPATEISDSTSAGRALLTAANAAAQRTALGLATVASSGLYADLGSKPSSFTPTPAGSTGQVQWNNGGTQAGASSFTIDAGGLPTVGELTTSNPATPASGVTVFTRKRSGKRNLAWIEPSGIAREAQRLLGACNIGLITCAGNTTSTQVFGTSITAVGSGTARAVASGSILSQSKRIGFTSLSSAGASGGLRSGDRQYWRGNAAGQGGFHWVTRFGIAQTQTGWRWFVGMSNTNTALSNAEPSSFLNQIGVGMDSTDTTIQFMFNDGAGTCTKVDTTLSAPTTSDVFELRLYCAPNSSSFQISIEKIGGSVAEYDTGASTDIPSNTTLLMQHWWINNNATAATVSLDLLFSAIEADV